ncbi:acyltransferase ChoActase/COT/CPT [Lipomyces kononenkoae]|uniref:Acyltransferase ChoActase/COT/CPT n=1 Tax=Lipomyces kononenkoae TaxID=34357 RepID=A0ACC3T6R8_LIPKO
MIHVRYCPRVCSATLSKMTVPTVSHIRSFGSVNNAAAAAAAAATAAMSSKPKEHTYAEDVTAGKMLRFQESLPRLPVPTLQQTAERYLKSVRPLLSQDQFNNTVKIVQNFISNEGEGPGLQKKLLAKAADPTVKNWVYDWWNDAAYLTYRDPVVPYVSYFYGHIDDSKRTSPVSRSAAIVTGALAFKRLIDTKELEPEYLKNLPMCMDSYKWMFNAARVPAPDKDYPVKYSSLAPENKNIIVIRKNRLYLLPHEVDGVQLSTAELEIQIQKIVDATDAEPKALPVGAITSANRDKGAEYRNHLLAADPINADLLAKIEAASFVLALDDAKPSSYNERANQFWHGDGANRWYDKPCQFIVCQNGVSGFMGEHSMMDGTPTCRLNDYVCDVIMNNKVDHGPSAASARQLADPVELKFVVSDALKADIKEAEDDFAAVIGLHELEVNAFKTFGKNTIKKFKTSPDAFVQMSFQLAYYRLYGKIPATYESATTRQYQLGRTEVCRSASSEALAFVQAFDDAHVENSKKIALLRAALGAHVKYISNATAGYGCDRHLFGLKNLADKNRPLPEIFRDKTYGYSTTWILSTSQLSSEYFNAYGWSQVTDEGYGIAYMINGNSLQFNIVSKHRNSPGMASAIGKALTDMAELLETELPVKAKL